MNKLLIFTSCTKFELSEITIRLLVIDILAVATQGKSEIISFLNNGYDVMNCLLNLKNSYPKA